MSNSRRSFILSCLLIGLVGLIGLARNAFSAQLLRDINSDVSDTSSRPQQFTAMGAITFFVATDDDHGSELWRTDGTAAGTFLLADIRPGRQSSFPEDFMVAGGTLYFSADDGVNGRELWRSDGTSAGTYMLADIAAGPKSGYVGTTVTTSGGPNGSFTIVGIGSRYPIVAAGSYIYFIASDTGVGVQLWRSDGTAAGTIKLVELDTTLPAPQPWMQMTAFGSRLALTLADAYAGHQLWISDGSSQGTSLIMQLSVGLADFVPDQLTAAGSLLFFTADDGTHGKELWCSDGTAAGTRMVIDATAGTGASAITYLTAVGSQVFYIQNDTTLWRSDGTQANTVQVDVNLKSPFLVRFGSRVVYRTGFPFFNSAIPAELKITDGTSAGTIRLFQSSNIDQTGRRSRAPVVTGNKIYFMDTTDADGIGIWSTDGASGTARLIKSNLTATYLLPTYTLRLINASSQLAYFLDTNSVQGPVLWRTDGSQVGTFALAAMNNPDDFYSSTVTIAGPLAYFESYDPQTGTEPWVTDGTHAGTHMTRNIGTGLANSSSYPGGFVKVGNQVMFAATPGNTAVSQLWTTDGTPAGTQVAPILPNNLTDGPSAPVALGSHTVFTAGTAATGRELWTTDGTSSGTVLVKDLVAGGESSGPDLNAGVLLGSNLIFPANSASGLHALWKTDGTAAGTTLLYSFTGTAGTVPFNTLTLVGNYVYFIINGPTSRTLWRTDGTVAGTVPAAPNAVTIDYLLGPASGYALFLGSDGTTAGLWRSAGTATSAAALMPGQGNYSAVVGLPFDERLVFEFCPPSTNCGTYISDGSSGGTQRLTDAQLQTAYSSPRGARLGNQLFFSAFTSVQPSVWVTDGTPAGTHILSPTQTPGYYPDSFTVFGGVVLFTSVLDNYDGLIWRTDGTDAGTWLVASGPKLESDGISTPTRSAFSAFYLVAQGSKLYFDGSDEHTSGEPFVLTATDPVAGDDRFLVAPPVLQRLEVLDNDGIVNGAIDSTTVTIVVAPALGSATVDTSTGDILYAPHVSAGRDSLTYTVKSVAGTVSNIGHVDLLIGGADGVSPTDPPTVTLQANASSVTSGQQVTLNWSVSGNATHCAASGGWSGTKPISGSEAAGPLSQFTSFTLSCDAPGGSSTQTVTVDVSPSGSGGTGAGNGGSGSGGTTNPGSGGTGSGGSVGNSGSGSGGSGNDGTGSGGGGAVGLAELLALALTLLASNAARLSRSC
jgi:ELWxxDGT repeat protein